MRRRRIVILAFGLLPTVTHLWPDTIEFKTGERIEGAFRQATSAGAVIEVGGQSITIPLEKVQAIYFGAEKPIVSAPERSAAAAPSADVLDALKHSGPLPRAESVTATILKGSWTPEVQLVNKTLNMARGGRGTGEERS